MESFDIQPFVGALPIKFGMHRSQVHEMLGLPEATNPIWDGSGTSDYWNRSRINVGYNNDGIVDHVGFGPGGFDLLLLGSVLWSADQQPDPNETLMRHDPAPLESLGILVYPQLGITTTGYHDGDENQRAMTIFPRGSWDKFLVNAHRPDLSKYGSQAEGDGTSAVNP